MDKALGQDSQLIVLGGKDVRMRAITVGMLADLMRFVREKPVRNFVQFARENDLPKDIVSAQVREFWAKPDTRTSDELMAECASDPDVILHLLTLRCAGQLTAAEVADLPIDEIMAMSDVISGDPQDAQAEKKTVVTE